MSSGPKRSAIRSSMAYLHTVSLRQGCSTFPATLVASASGDPQIHVEVCGNPAPTVIGFSDLARAAHFRGTKKLLALLLKDPDATCLNRRVFNSFYHEWIRPELLEKAAGRKLMVKIGSSTSFTALFS
jgi:hypothetical protein